MLLNTSPKLVSGEPLHNQHVIIVPAAVSKGQDSPDSRPEHFKQQSFAMGAVGLKVEVGPIQRY